MAKNEKSACVMTHAELRVDANITPMLGDMLKQRAQTVQASMRDYQQIVLCAAKIAAKKDWDNALFWEPFALAIELRTVADGLDALTGISTVSWSQGAGK